MNQSTDTSLRYSTATEGCVSNDFFRHSLDDSPASYLTQLPSPSLNTIELIVIHNRPCEHSSKLQLECLPLNMKGGGRRKKKMRKGRNKERER